MKFTQNLIIYIIFTLFLYGIAFAELSLTDGEKTYLAEKGIITFVSQTNYPPFEFIKEGQGRDGMCIELARWIATEFGFKAKFIDASFAEAQNMIQAQQADVLTSFFYSEKRDQLFDFTNTMFYIPSTIFIKSDRPDIKELSDLNGKKVAIQKGDYAEDFLISKGISFTTIHTSNFFEATNMVIKGEADAVIGDEQIVLYYLYSANLDKMLKKVGTPLYVGENSMATIEKNTKLVSIINKGILLAKERGVLKSITEKWLGVDLAKKQGVVYQYRWLIGIVFLSILGLLIVIWLWNIGLRREVQKRTSALQEKEELLSAIFENIPNMVFVKSASDLSFVKFNKAGEDLIGMTSEALYGKNDYDFFSKEQADFFISKDRIALKNKELTDIPRETIQTQNRGERVLHTKKIPILDEQGNPKYLLGISEDITDVLAAEKARVISEERLKIAIDSIDEGFVIYDSDDRFVMCNQKYKSLYPSIKHLCVHGTPYSEILDAYADIKFSYREEKDHWIQEQLKAHQQGKDDEVRLIEGRWVKLSDNKVSDGSLVGVRVDITDIKKSEEGLKQALKEKESLLKEIHHRVKNNMQVISSLLSIQSSNITDPNVLSVFNEAGSRIHAMALIHENLYKSSTLSNINVNHYLNDLTNGLSNILGSHQTIVNFHIDTNNTYITVDEAVPFGLVVTEIITNSMKYGFSAEEIGLIEIIIKITDNNEYQLTISDNGCGLPESFDPKKTNTLGIPLMIEIIEDQLEGDWSLENKEKGVVWTVVWPQSENTPT